MDIRNYDNYYQSFTSEEKFFDDVSDMMTNSSWIHDVKSSCLKLIPAEGPMFIEGLLEKYPNIDTEALEEVFSGTKLVISSEEMDDAYGIRASAVEHGLCTTAKLQGTSLKRMNPEMLSQTLNNGFSVAQGNSIMLIRYGKCSAIHSEQYSIIPMDYLLKITKEVAADKFGSIKFVSGINSHIFTSCIWELPDVQDELITMYQEALERAGLKCDRMINFMPAIKFVSSDVGDDCAAAIPVFVIAPGRYISFVPGIKVKHLAARSVDGQTQINALTKYTMEIEDVYAKFLDSAQEIERLASMRIKHPENCLIMLAKKYKIPRCYVDAAREEIMDFAAAINEVTAYDVYIAMTAMVQEAEARDTGYQTVNALDEVLGRILRITNWHEFDIGGTIEW